MSKFKYWALTAFGIFTALVFGGGSIFIGIRTGWLDLFIGLVFIFSGLLFIPYFQKKFFGKYPPEEQLRKGTGFGLLTMILGIGLSFYSGKKLMENPPEIPPETKYLSASAVKSGFYWGIINAEGKFIEPAKYQEISYASGAFLCYAKNGKRFLRTAKEIYEIPGELMEILQYYNTNVLAKSRETQKFGIWNLVEKKWKLSPNIEAFGELRYDLLPMKKNTWKVLDLQNNRYINFPENTDTVFVVNDTLLAFKKDKWTLINLQGKILREGLNFISKASREGVPTMILQGEVWLFPGEKTRIKDAVKSGESFEETFWYLSKNGKYYFYEQGVVKDSADFVVLETSEFPGVYLVKKGDKYFVKHSRKQVSTMFFPGQWQYVSELLFPNKKEKYGFRDLKGREILPAEWDSVGSYFLKVLP